MAAEGDWICPDMPAGVVALTTTRAGGASRGPYTGLNLAAHVGDAPEAVAKNRARLLAALGCARLQWLTQVHGATCVRVAAGAAYGETPEADAAWTDAPGVGLVVLTADCLPVVLAATDGSLVAVAHAGWRGLTGGVLESTLRCLPRPAAGLLAWLGPAIGPARYEVGEDVRRAACARFAGADACFHAGRVAGKYQLDLPGLARRELKRLGVGQIHSSGICCASDARFYSYRRDGVTGRMATLAWLTST